MSQETWMFGRGPREPPARAGGRGRTLLVREPVTAHFLEMPVIAAEL